MLRHRLEALAKESSRLAANLRFLRPIALAGFKACAETMAPPNDLGAPTSDDTDMVRRADAWWDLLPPESRGLMILLYAAMELGAPILGRRLKRLSKMSLEERKALFDSWRHSDVNLLNFVADGMKSPVVMMYLSHPAALHWLGVNTCEHPYEARRDLPARAPFSKEVAS